MIEVNRFTLPNGLRVVHHCDSEAAMASLAVTYDTGSRHEDPQLTGVAHLMEHVMFGGSANVPDFDAELTAAGGCSNAYTGVDNTTYYCVLPAHNIETAMHIESDRMLQPLLDAETVSVQRSVVTAEYRQQCLDRPYGDTMHHLLPMLYPEGHPYSWPVIGKDISHIARIGRDDLQQWFDRNYPVGNAVIGISGNISLERARELCDKWFGDIAPRPVTHYPAPSLVRLPETRCKTVYGAVPVTAITIVYPMEAYGALSGIAGDALTDLLADGGASLFRHSLILPRDSIFSQADASVSGHLLQDSLVVSACLKDESTDPESAIRRLTDTLLSVLDRGITGHDMQRLKNRRIANCNLADLDYVGVVQRLSHAEIRGEAHDEYLRRYLALSADDLLTTARRVFAETHPAILIYRPKQ